MTRMSGLASRLAVISRFRPPLALVRRGICGWRPTGVGGVLVQSDFKSLQTLAERAHHNPHTLWRLLPVGRWYVASCRKRC